MHVHNVKSGLFAQCRRQDEIHRGSGLKFGTQYEIFRESWTRGVNGMRNLRSEGQSSAAPAVLIVISSTCSCAGFASACICWPPHPRDTRGF